MTMGSDTTQNVQEFLEKAFLIYFSVLGFMLIH